jgi:SAM-dependent methyltransferase
MSQPRDLAAVRAVSGHDTMSSGLKFATRYHAWSHDWIRPYVAGRVLDIGGGNGDHLLQFEARELVSIDVSEQCVEQLSARFGDRAGWRFLSGNIAEREILGRLGPSSFDTVFSSNVFEHIADDQRAFDHCAGLLKPGGRLVLILPAHPRLYGSLDELAGHYRRYEKRDVRQKILRSGLVVERLRYVNILGAIGWLLNSRGVRHADLSSASINAQIRLFDRFIVPIARLVENGWSMPFGQSLVCVGRKT